MKIPQLIMIILWSASVGLSLAKHGEPKDSNYSVWVTLIAVGIEFWILHAGGFFNNQ